MSLVVDASSPNHTLAGPFGEVRVRVHAAAASGTGGLIFFHDALGPSFADTHERCAALAQAGGCAVIAVDSASISEPKFPRSVDEAYFIACFLHEHVDELGLDHRRIGIGGMGFGATLATAASRLAKERRNPELAFQLLLWPVLDLRASVPALGLRASVPARAELAARYLPSAADAEDPRASPLLAKNLIGLPPALIVSHAAVESKREAEAYFEALARAFVPSTLAVAEDFASALVACEAPLRAALGRS